ncbi:MAG TPA: NnrU family protein [Polyangiaceae bacterium]|nr:NnrU family protein [Polyangiaceae bacterium]
MSSLAVLGTAALVWLFLHVVVAGSDVRFWLTRRIGEQPFRAAFALASVGALVFLVFAYRRAPCAPLWTLSRDAAWLPLFVMPPAFVLLAGAFTVPNPTAVAAEAALKRPEPARGVLRITRHPFLWAVTLWAAAHLLVNGNSASLLFFGTLSLTAVLGTRSIDRKRARTHPDSWGAYRQRTSNLPFLALIQRRNRLVARELWLPIAIGAALTLATLAFHESLFHVAPMP